MRQALGNEVVGALGVFNVALEDGDLVALGLEVENFLLLRFERGFDFGDALDVDPVGGTKRADHAAGFGGDAIAQTADFGVDAGELGVIAAKPAGHLRAGGFLAREVGLEALDEAVLHHLGQALGAAALGLTRAAIDPLGLGHRKLG